MILDPPRQAVTRLRFHGSEVLVCGAIHIVHLAAVSRAHVPFRRRPHDDVDRVEAWSFSLLDSYLLQQRTGRERGTDWL